MQENSSTLQSLANISSNNTSPAPLLIHSENKPSTEHRICNSYRWSETLNFTYGLSVTLHQQNGFGFVFLTVMLVGSLFATEVPREAKCWESDLLRRNEAAKGIRNLPVTKQAGCAAKVPPKPA